MYVMYGSKGRAGWIIATFPSGHSECPHTEEHYGDNYYDVKTLWLHSAPFPVILLSR